MALGVVKVDIASFGQCKESDLNEKLARWVGFKHIPTEYQKAFGRPYPRQRYKANWDYPDGQIHTKLPNFIKDLNACFHWLVPQFQWHVITGNVTGLCTAEVRQYGEWGPEHKRGWASGRGAALVLCRAIEQLVDQEENGDLLGRQS